MKKEIREKYKKIRDNINNIEFKSEIIMQKIIDMEEYKNSNTIVIYKSFLSEVETDSIINNSLKCGKIVGLPKISNRNMDFYQIKSLKDKLVTNKFGIEEPVINRQNLINKERIDLAIIPGICFDIKKNRLGYGGGYYDRFLVNSKFIKIGICFEEQLFDKILPTEDIDIKMDYVITDKKII